MDGALSMLADNLLVPTILFFALGLFVDCVPTRAVNTSTNNFVFTTDNLHDVTLLVDLDHLRLDELLAKDSNFGYIGRPGRNDFQITGGRVAR